MDEQCKMFTGYMLGELSHFQTKIYEKHLTTCTFCKNEYQLLLPTHQNLSLDESTEDILETVFNQKSNVLAHAFSLRQPKEMKPFDHVTSRWWFSRERTKLSRRGVFATTTAVACIILAAVFFRMIPAHYVQTPPVYLVEKWILSPNPKFPQAEGMALTVHKSSQTNLIVYVNHVPIQSQWGCYDVWGVQNGKRYSLGEFTVDTSGDGALSINLDSAEHFNQLEITLEPQWGDHVPKGPKILQGTSVKV